MMKKLFIGIVLIIGLLLGAIVILPALIPASTYKDTIESQLATALGRDVAITGDVKLSVFPVLKAQTGVIEIDNADGFASDHLMTMDGLDARIRLLPLFSKRGEI
jgi:AsmA protein